MGFSYRYVDSMIVVDLIHFAMHTKDHLVVVSGDDDMWPGIRYALLQNATITHITPEAPQWRRNQYKGLFTKGYIMKTL